MEYRVAAAAAALYFSVYKEKSLLIKDKDKGNILYIEYKVQKIRIKYKKINIK